jgi:hypothetical protein
MAEKTVVNLAIGQTMQSISLTTSRDDLVAALQTLGTIQRRRGISVIPVWLQFDPAKSAFSITEPRGRATAVVPAKGSWTPAPS